jgi:hypothetical protein
MQAMENRLTESSRAELQALEQRLTESFRDKQTEVLKAFTVSRNPFANASANSR